MCMMEVDSPHPQGIFSFWRRFLQSLTLFLDFLEKKKHWGEKSHPNIPPRLSTLRPVSSGSAGKTLLP